VCTSVVISHPSLSQHKPALFLPDMTLPDQPRNGARNVVRVAPCKRLLDPVSRVAA
jgi:hypothetical protein